MQNVQRCCHRCFLTITDGITINNNGICNLCNEFDKIKTNPKISKALPENEEKSRKILKNYFEELKNRKNRHSYDCLLHLSGGKDSVMALYELKTLYNLNILAFMHDNGFESSVAKKNVDNVVKHLEVDLIYYNANNMYWPFYYFFKSEIRKKIDICTFCELFQEPAWAFAHELMKIYQIPLEITGSTVNAGGSQPLLQNDLILAQDFFKEIKPELFKKGYFDNKNLCQRIDEQFENNINRMDYWAEVPQNFEYTTKLIKEKLNWQSKYYDSTDTGCDLGYIQMVLDDKYPKKNNYRLIKATDIRMGHVTIDFYNKTLDSTDFFEKDEAIKKKKYQILQYLRLTEDEL